MIDVFNCRKRKSLLKFKYRYSDTKRTINILVYKVLKQSRVYKPMIISEQGLSVPKGKAIFSRKSSSLSNVKKLHCL